MKVVQIVGCMRSGSTILGAVLGAQPGWFFGGEMSHTWARQKWDLCGCGKPVAECEVWRPAFEMVRADLPASVPTLEWMSDFQRSNFRLRQIPALAKHVAEPTFMRREDVRAYLATRRRLYQAAAEVTGATIIVDSSKRPGSALLINSMPDVELTCVFLVRDPQAMVASEAKNRSWEGVPSTEFPPPRGVLSSAGYWLGTNFVTERWLRPALPRWISIRYEDWAADPREVTRQIVDAVTGTSAEDRAGDGFIDAHTVDLPRSHAISGNPSRFGAGRTSISTHHRVKGLSPAEQQIVKAVTAPLRGRYHYR